METTFIRHWPWSTSQATALTWGTAAGAHLFFPHVFYLQDCISPRGRHTFFEIYPKRKQIVIQLTLESIERKKRAKEIISLLHAQE